MLDLAIVDKLNRAGFVVAPYNTPEEVPSVKSVSGPARHVGEADKRGGGGQRGEKNGHKQNQDHVRPHRYQVERCAGPVEVQRVRKRAQPSPKASGDSRSKTGEQSSLMEAISIGIQERQNYIRFSNRRSKYNPVC